VPLVGPATASGVLVTLPFVIYEQLESQLIYFADATIDVGVATSKLTSQLSRRFKSGRRHQIGFYFCKVQAPRKSQMPYWRNPFDELFFEEDWKLFLPPLLFPVRSRIKSPRESGSVVLVYPLPFKKQ
jgi:hypothetical protein